MNIKSKKFLKEEYHFQLIEFKKLCKKLGHSPNWLDVSKKYGLRSSRWFVKYCENKKVYDYGSFLEYEIGIKPVYMVSKEFITKKILVFQNIVKREILRKDIQNNLIDGVTISNVQRLFGGVIKMKQELGMSVSSLGNVNREKSIEYIVEKLLLYFNYLKQNYIKTFCLNDLEEYFLNNNFELNAQTIDKKLRLGYNKTLREFSLENDLELNKVGRGVTYIFYDGEKVLSRYEKIFSEFLRKNGFIYNKNYFRDVKYSNLFNGIVDNRNGITLDYIILYKKERIYIEIAGVLRDYDKYYKENKTINSVSKEKYRKKLMEKENILKSNNVKYYIIFPCKYNNFEEKIFNMNLNFIK